jgi:hypothetical protein
MIIDPIFVEGSEGLHSAHYASEYYAEYFRLFEFWNDYELLLAFCKKNQREIFSDFYGVRRLEQFVEAIIDEAGILEDTFLNFQVNGFYANSNFLQTLFIPLDNKKTVKIPILQESKAKADVLKPKLRLYALRIDKNTFILTGGCIKLSFRMDDNIHTQAELTKIQAVKDYCEISHLKNQDDLSCYYEQQ